MSLLQWQDGTVIKQEEWSDRKLTSTHKLTRRTWLAQPDTGQDSTSGGYIKSPADGTDDCDAPLEGLLVKEAAQFWTWCAETRGWFHKHSATGEVIWAPFELD